MSAAHDRLREQGCQVVVVAQGLRESGLKWKKDYGLPFQLLLDREMELYRAFGIRRELKLVCTLEIFAFYAAKVVEGQKDNMAYEGDDFAVMGGDFIIRQNGEVAFARTQSGQFDRPEVAELLECLHKL